MNAGPSGNQTGFNQGTYAPPPSYVPAGAPAATAQNSELMSVITRGWLSALTKPRLETFMAIIQDASQQTVLVSILALAVFQAIITAVGGQLIGAVIVLILSPLITIAMMRLVYMFVGLFGKLGTFNQYAYAVFAGGVPIAMITAALGLAGGAGALLGHLVELYGLFLWVQATRAARRLAAQQPALAQGYGAPVYQPGFPAPVIPPPAAPAGFPPQAYQAVPQPPQPFPYVNTQMAAPAPVAATRRCVAGHEVANPEAKFCSVCGGAIVA